MKMRLCAASFAALALAGAHPAQAEELWNAYPLRGLGEGLSVAALPKGVYGVLGTYYAVDDLYDRHGDKIANTDTSAVVVVPAVVVAPGVKLLGADYSFLVAQPVDYTHAPGIAGSHGKGNVGLFNTIVSPVMLSWKRKDVHFRAGVTVYLPTAGSTIKRLRSGSLDNGGLPSGSNFTTIQPDVGVSYLGKGWNATAELHYAVPVSASKDGPDYRYRSGAELAADITLTKTVGKWTLGAGAHQTYQVASDRLNGQRLAGSRGHIIGLGPIVGYQLGPVTLQAIWNKSVSTRSNLAGNFFNVRLIKAL